MVLRNFNDETIVSLQVLLLKRSPLNAEHWMTATYLGFLDLLIAASFNQIGIIAIQQQNIICAWVQKCVFAQLGGDFCPLSWPLATDLSQLANRFTFDVILVIINTTTTTNAIIITIFRNLSFQSNDACPSPSYDSNCRRLFIQINICCIPITVQKIWNTWSLGSSSSSNKLASLKAGLVQNYDQVTEGSEV